MPAARRPDALRGRVFRKRDVVERGLLTPSELRSSAWRRMYRGVYADARRPDSFGLRVRGAALLVPSSGVFTGRTAALLHGAESLADTTTAVEVSVPPGASFGPVSGLRIRHVAIPPAEVAVVGGRRCSTAVRAALDIARSEPLVEAVVALDVIFARVVIGRSELHEAASSRSARGARRAALAVGLADHRSESPPESRLRVVLALAGMVAVPQYTRRDSKGNFVARVDLAFPEQSVAIEYDGAWHAEPGQFAKDRRRLNSLVGAGWTVVHVPAADLRDPRALIARIRALLATRNFGQVGV